MGIISYPNHCSPNSLQKQKQKSLFAAFPFLTFISTRLIAYLSLNDAQDLRPAALRIPSNQSAQRYDRRSCIANHDGRVRGIRQLAARTSSNCDAPPSGTASASVSESGDAPTFLPPSGAAKKPAPAVGADEVSSLPTDALTAADPVQ